MVAKREMLINQRLYEVADINQYSANKDAYLTGYVAVDMGVGDYILPVIPSTSTDPGVYVRPNAPFSYAREPKPEDAEQYRREHVIDYSDASTFREFIDKQNMVRELENDILSSPDNIFTPAIDPNDSPAMTALKQAVIQKGIDLDKYEPRFGPNYANDRRIFVKPDISMKMLVRMCNALDIKATLTLEDQDSDLGEIPNPMKNSISVELTSRSSEAEEEN